MRKKTIWLKYHFRSARKFQAARKKIHDFILDKNIKLRKKEQTRLLSAIKDLEAVRSLLDDHYHELITHKQFIKWGHIYYNEKGEKRPREER